LSVGVFKECMPPMLPVMHFWRGDLLSYNSHQPPFPFLNTEVINEVVVSPQVSLTIRNLSFAIRGTSEAGLKLKMVFFFL
jgi:hypothetical protein